MSGHYYHHIDDCGVSLAIGMTVRIGSAAQRHAEYVGRSGTIISIDPDRHDSGYPSHQGGHIYGVQVAALPVYRTTGYNLWVPLSACRHPTGKRYLLPAA